jgi:hypothetical protein
VDGQLSGVRDGRLAEANERLSCERRVPSVYLAEDQLDEQPVGVGGEDRVQIGRVVDRLVRAARLDQARPDADEFSGIAGLEREVVDRPRVEGAILSPAGSFRAYLE